MPENRGSSGERKLDQILEMQHHLQHRQGQLQVAQYLALIKMEDIMANLDALEASVTRTRGVVDSAIELIKGLRQQIIDAGTDPAKLADLVAKLEAEDDDLAAAVAANPTPTPTP